MNNISNNRVGIFSRTKFENRKGNFGRPPPKKVSVMMNYTNLEYYAGNNRQTNLIQRKILPFFTTVKIHNEVVGTIMNGCWIFILTQITSITSDSRIESLFSTLICFKI